MPVNVSSSSSEDEADNSPPEPAPKQTPSEKKPSRYQCPEDFVSFCHEPCSSTLTDRLKDENTELWLIKAPVTFKPESFSGLKVPLSGLQTLRVPADGVRSGQQVYSILASNHCASDLRLLTADRKSADNMVFSPAFSGLLNVCESYGDSSTNQAPQVIPATPAPAIPPGLKQRFHPFGSKPPILTCVAENEVDGVAFGPSSATLRPRVVKRPIEDTGTVESHDDDDDDGERKKKKKKKKEKRIKTERVEEEVRVKEEPMTLLQYDALMDDNVLEEERSEERRRKKKKKKDRAREEVEEGLEPSEDVKVKSEPIDSWCSETAESSGKKKKKKKKCKVESD